MARKRSKRPLTPAKQMLAKLRKLYSQPALQLDALGRRPALPSEIASHLKHIQPASGSTKQA
jgi:hypothetical protein